MQMHQHNPNLKCAGRHIYNTIKIPFIRKKDIAESNNNPSKGLEARMKASLSEGAFTGKKAAFAIFACLSLYGAAAAAAGLSTEPKEIEKKEKTDYSLKILAKQADLESKILAKPQDSIKSQSTVYKDATNDIEITNNSINEGIDGPQPAHLDIKSLTVEDNNSSLKVDLSLNGQISSSAEYAIAFANTLAGVSASITVSNNTGLIYYWPSQTTSKAVIINDNNIIADVDKSKAPQDMIQATARSTSGNCTLTDYLWPKNSVVSALFAHSLNDSKSDAIVKSSGKTPDIDKNASEIIKLGSSQDMFTGIYRVALTMTNPLPDQRIDSSHKWLYDIQLGDAHVLVGQTDDINYPKGIIVYSDGTSSTNKNDINIFGNFVMASLDPNKVNLDPLIGDSVKATAEQSIGDPQENFTSVIDTAQSGTNLLSVEDSNSSQTQPLGPTFILSAEEKLLPGTPEKLLNPVAGDDNNVANNHANGQKDQQQFIASGKPIVLYNRVVNPDDHSIYKEYWIYYTDNPATIIPKIKDDHHAHDWEVVIDKYTSDGKFVSRATSFHINPLGASGRGWLYVPDLNKPVLVELAGHAMTTDPNALKFPDFIAKDSKNGEDLHPIYHHKDGKILTPKDYALLNSQAINDDNQLDADGRYKTDGYPPAADAIFGDAAKVPWKETIYAEPWQVFDSPLQSGAKLWQNVIKGSGLEARFVVDSSKVLGEQNGTEKADFYGAYTKSDSDILLSSDDFSSYGNVQLEIYGKESSHYKINMYVMNTAGGQSISEEKIVEKDIKKGETHIITLNPTNLQPIVKTPANPDSGASSSVPPLAADIAMVAAGFFLTLGTISQIKKYLKQRKENEEKHGEN